MALQCAARFQCSPLAFDCSLEMCRTSGGNLSSQQQRRTLVPFMRREGCFVLLPLKESKLLPLPFLHCDFRKWRYGSGKNAETMKSDDEDGVMDDEERREMRKKIWDVIDNSPDIQEELDPEEKKRKMEKLLAEYPLVVEEEDPDWPEDADGRGFSLDQFFNKITIKNVKKDDDDENDDSDSEIVWQDDDYICPIKDISHITASEWGETVFKDISPLIILVHNRYKRLPSPRCVAIDAVVDYDLVSALNVSGFPELIFTKSGKIIYREKATRPADELSKIMAFFYYGAAKPPFFEATGNIEEPIPLAPISAES